MREDREQYLKYRKNVETEMVAGFKVYHRKSPESKGAEKVSLPLWIVDMELTIPTVCPVKDDNKTCWTR